MNPSSETFTKSSAMSMISADVKLSLEAKAVTDVADSAKVNEMIVALIVDQIFL